MIMYEKYIGRHRDDYVTLEDLYKNFKVTCPDDFNFAYDVLDKLAEEKPDQLAMLWVSNSGEEKRITFAEMKRWSDKTANYFKSLGIKKGDLVLLVLKRSYLFWYAMMALHKIGAVAVQATNLLTAKDYIYRCQAAGIKMAVITADGDCTRHFDEAAPECKTVQMKAVTKHKEAGEGWLDFEAGVEAASDKWERPTGEEATKVTDMLIMAFSSGTTGYPKMVSHDHAYPLGHIMTGIFWHRVEPGGLHFTISDTGWLKSLWGKMYGQWLGESAIFTYDFDTFNGADILQKLEKYQITTFCAPPTMYRFMLREDVKNFNLSALKHCCTAGEALNPEVFNQWRQATGLRIFEGFGQSETTVCCSILYPWVQPRPGSMGMPTPGYQMVVADEDGKEVDPGVTGEICIKAPDYATKTKGLFMGYYRDEVNTQRSWHDGLYHTGDLAYRDELGFLWYIGRNDDIIKSSGYRIGPFEVESALAEHPAVLESAVTGVPDPIRGFNVKATIVLNKGYEPSEDMIKELQDHVKKVTAPYKYPRVIEFVTELPKTISGKIRRVEIREKDSRSE
ncbi:Acetyl-coenzyme A synthetase [Dehalobacter sp. UNSWDHB]|jgi:Acyl-coenzyme A synthetases/AMP-(fatty) acid ligases|uniref:AMP-binding protein n=1 Tax=unclassified Dehalobacter TaxID=2635733 RepID=UPI00028ADDC1|nr:MULTISPECIES: AMP-binding protein [unclassified Dehalobacter]AFV01946.1 Acetyl-coenzyme A synthetase [Dehalobacter sp. DCA]AFV04981.1 Acyl-coenzyme A synthetase/AMP-(fatty) acid ligase [Dehalobacter sp. CF]EQB21309.1 Acetyl-coenzyme A synthetase [Dehalobacter sp. UNSWDHB]